MCPLNIESLMVPPPPPPPNLKVAPQSLSEYCRYGRIILELQALKYNKCMTLFTLFDRTCLGAKITLLTSVSFLHSGHLMLYFYPSRFTSLSRQRLQYECKQVNTRGSTNSSIHTGHSKLSNRFSRFSTRPVAIVLQ